MNNRIKIVTFSFLFIALLTGCSATGPQFQSFETTEADRDNAVIYFYRPDEFMLGSKTFNVMQVDEVVDEKTGEVRNEIINKWRLYNNSYYKETLPPGIYPLTTNWMFATEDFTFKANELTCIKLKVTASSIMTKHPDLLLVDKKTCEEEILKTQKMTEEDRKEHYIN